MTKPQQMSQHALDSSVGRAVDCSGNRRSIGHWFDSGSRDMLGIKFYRRGGLVGYDAAFTQLRSGVRFPSPVRGFFLFHTAVVDDACLFMMTD